MVAYAIDWLIVNPVAGRGRAARDLPRVLHLLRAAGHGPEVLETARRGDALQHVARLPPGESAVAVLAGDGTLNDVINGLRGRDRPVLLLPSGTGNDTARSLNIPRDALELAATACSLREIVIDLGEIAGHLFANNAGIGLDGEVCRLAATRRDVFHGRLGYVLAFIACALNMRATPMHLTWEGTSAGQRSLMITVANGQYYGGGMRIAPCADVQDGRLDVCAVLDIDRIGLLRAFPLVYSGSHVDHPCFRMWQTDALAVSGVRPLTLHADGEVIGRLSTDATAPTRIAVATTRQRFLVPA